MENATPEDASDEPMRVITGILSEHFGQEMRFRPSDRLCRDIAICGIDACEFIASFLSKFGIDPASINYKSCTSSDYTEPFGGIVVRFLLHYGIINPRDVTIGHLIDCAAQRHWYDQKTQA